MKATSVVVVSLVAFVIQVTGQGEGPYANYVLANRYPVAGFLDAPVLDWAGVLLAGEEWRVELYGGAQSDSLSPVLRTGDLARETGGFYSPGYFSRDSGKAGSLFVPSVAPYGWAWLQVKVWDVRLGATFEDAVAQGVGGYGESALFQAQGGSTADDHGLPGYLFGLTSFSVSQAVPEPAVSWLLLAGLPVWWWCWRGRWKAEGGRGFTRLRQGSGAASGSQFTVELR